MQIKLPDYDDFIALTNKIRDLLLYSEVLDNRIKEKEAKLHQRFLTDPDLYYKGKPLSSTAIKSAYEFSGFNDELVELRNEHAKAKADLEQARLEFKTYEMMVDLYRTNSANQRASTA